MKSINWSNVRLIMFREIRDQLRDRRTCFMIAVLPMLLYPILGMSVFQVAQFVREQPTRVYMLGAEHLPATPKLIDENHFAQWLFRDPESTRLLELHFAKAEPEAAATEGDSSPAGRARKLIQEG